MFGKTVIHEKIIRLIWFSQRFISEKKLISNIKLPTPNILLTSNKKPASIPGLSAGKKSFQEHYGTYVRLWGPSFEILISCQKIFNFLSEQQSKYTIMEAQYIEPKELSNLDFDLCIAQTKIKIPSKSEEEEELRSGKEERKTNRIASLNLKEAKLELEFEEKFFRSLKKSSRRYYSHQESIMVIEDLIFYYSK